MLYPTILLPRPTYPVLENRDIRDNVLVRETPVDVYQFLEKAGYESDDIPPLLLPRSRLNYWHFELWVNDSTGNRIPRDKSSAHIKYLAKSILEYIIAKAVMFKTISTFTASLLNV